MHRMARVRHAAREAGQASGGRGESPAVIVLGIDPGTANTGYGVVMRRSGRLAALDGGVIATRAELAPSGAWS